MRFYSIIIPVYNRPIEIDELLTSLVLQTYKKFEVIVIDDGSTLKADKVIAKFQDQLDIHYYWKENSGQGFARNYGYENAKGDYSLVFDSDCIIPQDYLQKVEDSLNQNYLDAFGGPDNADTSFTWLQRAINFSMTSKVTTGGIRGDKSSASSFTPRSFNMGITAEVFNKTGGYILPRMGEDIEFSIRIRKNNFKVGLIPEAFVFHKRRTNFLQFFRQLHFFGRARINVYRFHPESLKITHFFPAIFVFGIITIIFALFVAPVISIVLVYSYAFYFILIFLLSLAKTLNPVIALLSIPAAFIQLTAYGIGFIIEGLRYLFGRRK
jgi:glycosyltransferase involved in cell wall biosynthesis